jgi:predicted alpha/beta-hydrolase family hydrolase
VIARASGEPDPLIEHIQRELTAKKMLTLSFPMPFMQAGKKGPDDMRFMKRTYQAAVALLAQDPSAAPAHVFIGGKNMGALVAAHAATTRMRIEGLFLFGFPLHKQDDPSDPRSEQLFRAITPMLFVQGQRDRHCDLPTLRRTLARVGAPVQLHVVDEADHALRVPKKSGRTPEQVNAEILSALEGWMKKTLGAAS